MGKSKKCAVSSSVCITSGLKIECVRIRSCRQLHGKCLDLKVFGMSSQGRKKLVPWLVGTKKPNDSTGEHATRGNCSKSSCICRGMALEHWMFDPRHGLSELVRRNAPARLATSGCGDRSAEDTAEAGYTFVGRIPTSQSVAPGRGSRRSSATSGACPSQHTNLACAGAMFSIFGPPKSCTSLKWLGAGFGSLVKGSCHMDVESVQLGSLRPRSRPTLTWQDPRGTSRGSRPTVPTVGGSGGDGTVGEKMPDSGVTGLQRSGFKRFVVSKVGSPFPVSRKAGSSSSA
ncbi:uncharacterized protein BDZ83DRAFT_330107 [Colletotrichum acutatum]|uniref:Uncharacterized protein n=1 Tax=Glomerella acutata TaxID=27357 RepID=A0AAD8UQM3_GLOAC|nr:uncharacterized protein BDZ83DRAFT_330107 [Colletotrichum acutatum]KAK1724675.1 hypothetical protein BDZ83DRAFT_330107 [Colletotrichum acutatum]